MTCSQPVLTLSLHFYFLPPNTVLLITSLILPNSPSTSNNYLLPHFSNFDVSTTEMPTISYSLAKYHIGYVSILQGFWGQDPCKNLVCEGPRFIVR